MVPEQMGKAVIRLAREVRELHLRHHGAEHLGTAALQQA
jgi:hypothetical protein